MKKFVFFALLLFLGAAASLAQDEDYITVTKTSSTSEAYATESVGVTVVFTGTTKVRDVGAAFVFCVDNSGSMDYSDPDNKRFKAIKSLMETYKLTRDGLDRIAVVVFSDKAEQVQGFKTWEQMGATIDDIVALGDDPDGYTNISGAMALSSGLLNPNSSDRFYRMGIILTDGYPEPDSVAQEEYIIGTLIPAALSNRILYSTVFLSEGLDNALLKDIALGTDYMHEYTNLPAIHPFFYRRIDDPGSIFAMFDDFFSEIKDRAVAKDVTITERIDGKLDIVGAPTFYTDCNVNSIVFTGTNATPDTEINAALEKFRQTGVFKLSLREFEGTAMLSFRVKLDLSQLTDSQLGQEYIIVNADNAASNILYTYPTPDGSYAETTMGLPLLPIKFWLGARTDKSLVGDLVTITSTNASPRSVERFQIIEFPSEYLNASDIKDNFGFDPFTPIADLFGVWSKAKAPILKKIGEKVNPYLCMTNRNNKQQDDRVWNTESSRGIYKLKASLPARDQRFLSIGISGACYLEEDLEDLITFNVDAEKSGYKFKPVAGNQVTPLTPFPTNPPYSLRVNGDGQPDLYVLTCFNDMEISDFYEGLLGWTTVPAKQLKAMLDSDDIKYKVAPPNKVYLAITVRNCGDKPASAHLRIESVFVPKEGNNCYFMTEDKTVTVQAHGYKTVDVTFSQYWKIKEPLPEFMKARPPETVSHMESLPALPVGPGMLVNGVEIYGAEGEEVLINNSAIEILGIP
jgi:hypothetical protein